MKRDGSLTLNICCIDILYTIIILCIMENMSCCEVSITSIILSHYMIGAYVLSWFNQLCITLFRWIIIHYPFTYKQMVNKYRSCCFVIGIWIAVILLVIITFIISGHSDSVGNSYTRNVVFIEFFLSKLSIYFASILIALQVLFTIATLTIEFYIQRTAVTQHRKSTSFTNRSFIRKLEKKFETRQARDIGEIADRSIISKNSSLRRSAIAQTRKKSFIIALFQLISVILFYIFCVRYFINNKDTKEPSPLIKYIGYIQQLFMAARPFLNMTNFISLVKLRRFLRLVYRNLFFKKDERLTEYYTENSEEVEKIRESRRSSSEMTKTDSQLYFSKQESYQNLLTVPITSIQKSMMNIESSGEKKENDILITSNQYDEKQIANINNSITLNEREYNNSVARSIIRVTNI